MSVTTLQPFELGGATYFSKIGPRSGGFTIWPGSHVDVYRCHEQEFIPTPKANGELAETVARIKAETTPFEFVGDVGDVILVSVQAGCVVFLSSCNVVLLAVGTNLRKQWC